jgi:hypothetical protein
VDRAAARGDADALLRLLREAGRDLAALTPTRAGESGEAFWAVGRDGTVGLLKIMPRPGALGYLRALEMILGRLRERGYPAPPWRDCGEAAGLAFWIQQLATGTALDRAAGVPDGERVARLLPGLLRLNDAQAGLGDAAAPVRLAWPELIATTLTEGGDGYCVHATLAADPRTRGLLDLLRRTGDRCGPAIGAGRDFVHYDFSPANLLSDGFAAGRRRGGVRGVVPPGRHGAAITGVIDINPPVLAGDRAFDLATLLFYLYDHEQVRAALLARLLSLAGGRAAAAYLAHMVLRQVDWSLRFHPEAAATRRHLRLARLVAADLDGIATGGGQAGQS